MSHSWFSNSATHLKNEANMAKNLIFGVGVDG